ncbi:hypothetical protein FOZ60_001207, partial [Perkinsus olseni]
LKIFGAVTLRVATPNISIEDQFIVTDDCLTVPLLLGCPTLAKLKTSIHVTSKGTRIHTNVAPVEDTKVKGRVKFSDKVEYFPEEIFQGWEHPTNEIMVNYQVHIINQLVEEDGTQRIDKGLITVEKFEDPISPWYWARCPDQGSSKETGDFTKMVCFAGPQDDERVDRDSNKDNKEMKGSRPPQQKDTDESEEGCIKVMGLNVDGIDLPSFEGYSDEEVDELKALERYAAPDGLYEEGILNDADFERCVAACVRRCQSSDDNLRRFKLYLNGDITKGQLGMDATKLQRLGRICYLDQDGLIHRKPSDPDETEREQDTGVLYLGESGYSDRMVRLLAAIYHYIYSHLGIPRVYGKLKLRYSRKGLKRLVRATLRSCIPCLKARAARSLDYVTTHVQGLLTKGLWQVVGADLAGPYGRRGDSQGDDEEEHYLLLVHDHVSGFTCARPLKDSKPKTVAEVFHSIFCEHGAPRVLITDRDRVHLMRKDVKVVLAKHGVRYYTLPGYAQFLSFWERAHKDFVEVTRALRVSIVRAEGSYVEDYQLAVRAYNITPRMWANVSPAELHFTYGIRVPGERGDGDDDIDWDELKVKYFDTDLLSFVKDSIPLMENSREDYLVTMREYLELWRMRQERNLERVVPSEEEIQQPEDGLLPPDILSAGSSEEGVPSEDEDLEDDDIVDLSRLREQLGIGEGYEFGRFMSKVPPSDAVVIVVDHEYNGLATVLEGDEGTDDGSVLVQPMRVELLGGCIELKKAIDVDIITVQLDGMVYVSPTDKKWTRRRSREMLQLLHDVQVPRC